MHKFEDFLLGFSFVGGLSALQTAIVFIFPYHLCPGGMSRLAQQRSASIVPLECDHLAALCKRDQHMNIMAHISTANHTAPIAVLQSHPASTCSKHYLVLYRPLAHLEASRARHAPAQQTSPQAAAGSRDTRAALYGCTMEQLPPGGTAFGACTLEQLPPGRGIMLPQAVASPAQREVSTPVSVGLSKQGQGRAPTAGLRQEQQKAESGQGTRPQGQGMGQGLRGIGLFARNAAAALCSARRQTLEPRNPYRLDTSSTNVACLSTAKAPLYSLFFSTWQLIHLRRQK